MPINFEAIKSFVNPFSTMTFLPEVCRPNDMAFLTKDVIVAVFLSAI